MSLLPRIHPVDLDLIGLEIADIRPAADEPIDQMVTVPLDVHAELLRLAIAGRRSDVLDLNQIPNTETPLAPVPAAEGHDQEGIS